MIWTTNKLEFNSQQKEEIFLFSIASRPFLGPTQPPIQLLLGAVSLERKWLGHEVKNGDSPRHLHGMVIN
jgi:hypothetical protein